MLRCSPCASSACSRAHSATNDLRAPRFRKPELIDACISATSSRRRSEERSTSMSFSMRACTARIAWSSVVQSSNSSVSASTRLSISLTFEPFLPRRPRSSSVCSASWRRWSPSFRTTWSSMRCRAFLHDLLEHMTTLRQQLGAERGLELGQAALVEAHLVAADARGQRLARREREHALHRHAERARRLLRLLRDLRLDLLERRERIVQRVDLVEDDEARRRVCAEVIAPDREVGLGDAGVGAEDEHRRVRARQQAQRQLGLGADRVEARRVEHHQALLQERMRVVDERVAPGGHLDLAVVVDGGVVVGRVVVPEAERARLLLADPFRARHFEQRLGELVGILHVEREPAPGARLAPHLAERQAFEARLDRQKEKRRGLVATPAELDRAHRRAARRGRQDAAAGVGEEDRVDELRLAARELRDERDDELLVAQTLAQRRDLIGRVALRELVLGEEAGERFEALAERGTPAAEGVEAGGERGSHRAPLRRSSHRSAAFSQATRSKHIVTVLCGPFARCAASWPAIRCFQRRWQPGQKKVARAPCTIRRTVVPQRRQSLPARP